MIEAINLTKTYNGFPAVDRVSFQVNEGETLGLIGTSGCGKTTTLKMLNRLIEPSSGSIFIAGEDIRQHPPEKLRRRIGYVIQNTGLFPHFTVAENVAIVPRLLKWKEQRILQRTTELLELVGLSPETFAHRYPKELSGGQQQRVGLARALAADPPIILLDEPFGALDQITRHQIQEEFKRLKRLFSRTMVLVTHDISEAVLLCDRLALMDRGKLQQLGTPKELIFEPKNEFVRDFFKNNRFQLELQITCLKDILPYLSSEDLKEVIPQVYWENQNLLEVLEAQEHSSLKSSLIEIRDQEGNYLMITSLVNILSAFYQLKNQ
ncbi:ABC transporter related [Gloeothece citriformis PCC 7424]|uniref:ABC-type quaternary amine transporter n=1 Tax=Gloeothece citriformis (strain PCC 7424) TaxID=65393 RepID=B7K7F5_GLOC7|nr:ABC transporter ATP-binding protein [Gloeothece citriformis]ACK69723.1 ABC transporter related [Gloeothece citriformis PCC 7424]